MSNRQLEERRDRQLTEAVALALGVPVAELEAQEWSIEPNVGNDDMIYSYIVTLENGEQTHIVLPED